MCFYVNKLICPTERIATEDIICYKILSSTRNWLFQQIIVAPFRDKKYWKISKKLPEEITVKHNRKLKIKYGRIDEGLHSCINKFEAIYLINSLNQSPLHWHKTFKIYKCIIPAGASYYINECDYVSNKLIVNTNPINQ